MDKVSYMNNDDDDIQGPNGGIEDLLHSELESIRRDQRNRTAADRDRDLNMYRSGSAPPTVEGSLSAVGSLFASSDFGDFGGGSSSSGSKGFGNDGVLSEDEVRSHPDYLAFYYSHYNVNPRLPPPLVSKEDWRVAQRFQGGGGNPSGRSWDSRKKNGESSSLFSMQPGISMQSAEKELMELRNSGGRNQPRQASSVWLDGGSNGSIGSASGGGLGMRRKSFADILQEGTDRPASVSNFLSRPSSSNSFSEEAELMHNGVAPHGLVAPSSLSRSTTPELKVVGRSPGSGLPPVGSRVPPVEQRNFRGVNVQSSHSTGMNELSDLTANLSGLSLSKIRNRDMNNHGQLKPNLEHDSNSEFLFQSGYKENFRREFVDNAITENLSADLARINGTVNNSNASKLSSNMHTKFPRRTSSSANLYSPVGSSGFGSLDEQYMYHQDSTDFISSAFPVNRKHNSSFDSTHLEAVLNSIQNGNMNNLGNKAGTDHHSLLSDPRFVQLLQRNPEYAARIANNVGDLSQVRNQYAPPHGEFEGLQKAYLEKLLLAQQRDQLDLSLLGNSSGLSHDNYGIGSYGHGLPYQGYPNSVLPSVGSGNLMFQNERISRFNSMMRNSMGRSVGSINSDISNNLEERTMSSLLDEFKNSKIKAYELSDIVDHVVEFSTDQYGSRFIQQKLETATAEEKTKIFPEIIPHAHALMTDVFGNYVIQKFFEHGTQSQRMELADQLTGHVLPLSLQMYGCRVIQKALEVVEVVQQTQMVAELDGSIMKCVRDQNGNHVIQKCIECVPQDRIQFIISAFYGQVVTLSTHPYGCRVIQRVLEHCDDPTTQKIIMNEIMQSVCSLAQDQYGNYVIQHILQHGKPHERSTVICKLAGQIVRMSQQKFASNVVEKCLTFGSLEERQILVNEMLGSTDENEPLQAMMKDPFGNYVVQKVLETCDDESLELLLSRIKVHLNTLKRFTYGKHIVSRIEKLVATGERRIGLLSTISS